MKTLGQFGIIMFILPIGHIIQYKFNLFIPGTILGMLILLLLLLTRIIKLRWIENITNVLLEHLSILFVPTSVGIMVYLDEIKDSWGRILLVAIISTIVVMGVTGAVVQYLDKVIGKKEKGGNI
ncbi:MAG: CidA/LrgA family protein [Tissierellia bacterium]|nr:CidA/LrgA family protein [Tissierellia bacterium]